MNDRSGGNVAIRLSLKDAELVRRGLQAIGKDGEGTLKRLDAAGKQPTASMRALNDAMEDIGSTAQGMASRLGPAGAALQALGPWGVAAAAGLAAVGGGLAILKSSASELALVRASAMTAGLDTGTFQEVTFAAQQFRVEANAVTDGIKELQLRADEFVQTGSGPAAESFQRLGLNAGELASKLQDPVRLFEEILDRARNLDRAGQIRVFDELFGGSAGEQFVRLLDDTVGRFGDIRAEARDAGAVIDEEVLKQAAEIDREFQKISTTVGTQFKSAVVSVGGALQDVLQQMRESEPPAWVKWVMSGGTTGTLARLFQSTPEAPIENTELRGRSGMFTPAPWVPLPQSRPATAGLVSDEEWARRRQDAERAQMQAVRDGERAERERMQTLREAAQVKLELGDYTAALAESERELTALREAGAISEAEYTAALKLRKEELIEVARSMDKSGFGETLDEIGDGLRGAISGISSDLQRGVSGMDAIGNAITRLKGRLLDLVLDNALDIFFGGGKGGGNGIFGSLVSGLFGGGPGAPMSLSGRASGGPVAAGQLYRVNENGTELFRPNVSGYVVPSHLSGQSAGSGGIGEVNIFNSNGGEVRQERRKGPDGRDVLDVYIDQRMDDYLSRGRGDGAMRNRYGTTPRRR